MPTAGEFAVLFSVGLVAGFINVLAGGGSLLTLPALIFVGLPGTVANGTNRISLLIQNFSAIIGFRRQKVFPLRTSLMASGPALVGAVIGANLAVDIPDRLFKPILAVIMVGVMIIMVIDPTRRIKAPEGPLTARRKLLFVAGFFLIGIYGGFIQAGAGFIIITLMLFAGIDLVKINAVKILVVTFLTIIALAIFILHDQVNYLLGVSMGAGSALGGWMATHVAVKKGHAWIRGFVIVMVVLFAAKLIVDSLYT